jgi:hypothetical protein
LLLVAPMVAVMVLIAPVVVKLEVVVVLGVILLWWALPSCLKFSLSVASWGLRLSQGRLRIPSLRERFCSVTATTFA